MQRLVPSTNGHTTIANLSRDRLRPKPPLSAPLEIDIGALSKVGSAECCGDEPWFADTRLRQTCLGYTKSATSVETNEKTDMQRALQKICSVVGSVASPEMLDNPGAPLIAEASKLLSAILGLGGEGVPMDSQRGLRRRAVAAFTSSPVWAGCIKDELLSMWYDEDQFLALFAEAPMRKAYESMPKRFRAQFFCMLFRVAAVEAVRNDGSLRPSWPAVLAQFPEVGIWQEFKDRLLSRVWLPKSGSAVGRDGEDDDVDEAELSEWAVKWRNLINIVFPSGRNGAACATDHDLRCLAADLWKDVVDWTREEYDDAQKQFHLFTVEADQVDTADKALWAFIPAMDLLLTVGDGMLTITAEGASTDAPPNKERQTYSAAMRQSRHGNRKRGLQLPFDSQPKAKKTKLNRAPTRIVLLTNMVGAGDVDEDLEQETAEEAAKYGKLVKCTVVEIEGAPDEDAVRIFLEFDKVQAASKAYSDLNGRFFGGRSVKARFFDEERYAKSDLGKKAHKTTRTLLLTGIVSSKDADEDLALETVEEAAKFGEVTRCAITLSPGAPCLEGVQIFIDYANLGEALQAQAELNGRVYGGHELKVRFVEEGSTFYVEEVVHDGSNQAAAATASCQEGGESLGKETAPLQGSCELLVVGSQKIVGERVATDVPVIAAAASAEDVVSDSEMENLRDKETGLWML